MLRVVVFVVELAHDLLDRVLDRDHAGDAAVFVADDGHMVARLLHLMEQVVGGLGFRHIHRLAHDRLDRAGARIRVERGRAHGVLEIRHAEQVVDVAADDRHTGETGA